MKTILTCSCGAVTEAYGLQDHCPECGSTHGMSRYIASMSAREIKRRYSPKAKGDNHEQIQSRTVGAD